MSFKEVKPIKISFGYDILAGRVKSQSLAESLQLAHLIKTLLLKSPALKQPVSSQLLRYPHPHRLNTAVKILNRSVKKCFAF